MALPASAGQERVLRWAALSVIYVVWGTTYLAIRVMDRSIPPLVGASVRFLAAGLVLAAWVAVRHGPAAFRWSWPQVCTVGLTALLLVVGGPGLTTVAEHSGSSGLAALLVSSEPLWVVLWRMAFRERVGWIPAMGVALGLAGVAVLVLPSPGSGVPASALSVVLLLVVALSSATGSFWYSRLPVPGDAVAVTAAQMLLAGAVLGIAGLASGQFARFDPGTVQVSAAWALLYLTAAGSVLAYTAYLWLLRHVPVTLVTTSAYVNPVIAVILGAVILSERLTAQMIAGAVLTVTAVAIIVRPPAPDQPARRSPARRRCSERSKS